MPDEVQWVTENSLETIHRNIFIHMIRYVYFKLKYICTLQYTCTLCYIGLAQYVEQSDINDSTLGHFTDLLAWAFALWGQGAWSPSPEKLTFNFDLTPIVFNDFHKNFEVEVKVSKCVILQLETIQDFYEFKNENLCCKSND